MHSHTHAEMATFSALNDDVLRRVLEVAGKAQG